VSSALLLMDFQADVVGRLGSDDVVAAARRALDAARGSGVPVVFVRVGFRPGAPEVSARNQIFASLGAQPAMGETAAGTQVVPELAPQDGEVVVLKRRVSAFTGSDLEVVLRAAGVDHLVLAGIATSGVVLSTLREAADRDYRLTVLADACSDRDDEVHRVLTEKVFPRQADVTDVASWAGSLA
jgi:nicotinamidase-related amidase